MAKTRSMTRNQKHDDDHSSSRKKKSNTFDKGDVSPWSDLNDDVLLLVLMQLGFIDYYAFSGVCKSWRSLALFNKKRFMSSKPPMEILGINDGYCLLKDCEERRFKSILPHSAGRICCGLTCGYLILMGMETHDFWLVNPITRHQLHFPLFIGAQEVSIRAILVFSPSISRWVFVVLHRLSHLTKKISFYIEGKQSWNDVSSTVPIIDLHFFKGKIYTLHTDCSVIETKNFPKPDLSFWDLVSSGEILYAISGYKQTNKVMELDFGEMKWVLPEKTLEEYAFFISTHNKSSAAMKLESWAGPLTRFKSYAHFLDNDKTQKCMFYYKWIWYFPHDCLTVNILDE